MPEAHNAERVVFVLGFFNVCWNVVDAANLVEHVQHRFVSAAM